MGDHLEVAAQHAVIKIVGAAENNLRDVSVALPAGLSAVVGVSGSGKSSLAFDTLYGEARRRYFEVLSLGSPWLRARPARVRRIEGLGPAVSVAQNVLNRNPNSTVATAAGIHPYLRVLYARFGERRCAACGTETVITSLEHQLATLRRLVASPGDAVDVLAPLVRRAEGTHARLLDSLARRWGRAAIEVDGRAWRDHRLDPDMEHDIDVRIARVTAGMDVRSMRGALQMVMGLGSPQVVLRSGSTRHSLTRAPLCPGCGRPFDVLAPEAFNREGTAVETYRLGGLTLPELLGLDVAAALTTVRGLAPGGGARAASDQVARRLDALAAVGLGYLALDRSSPSLSRGEAQRLRIALILANPIEDLLHVLDEPTIGLDPGQMGEILSQVARLRGPVVMVEHDRWAVAAADHVVELGPGAGSAGGRVVFDGAPAELWRQDTASGAWFSGRERIPSGARRSDPTAWLRLRGATHNNLRELDISVPIGRLTVVAGPSGAGKTTLVRDVIVASLTAREPRGCTAVEGPALRPVTITQEPIGRNARSSAATYSGLADGIRRLFARATGEAPARFSFNRPEGACAACNGIGSVEIKLPYVPSEWLTCEACEGRRFRPDVLDSTILLADGVPRSIADVYDLPVDAAAALLADGGAGHILASLRAVGLGYLGLGQPSPTLSGGEAQRVKLAKWLSTARPGDLVVLDEPTTGLHPSDIGRLVDVLQGLVERGCTVLVVEHQPDVIAAADWVVRLGPGGGADGGRLVHAGPPATDPGRRPPRIRPRSGPRRRPRAHHAITVTGASVNNLRNVSVAIPKGAITGVAGVSGSGKSSLVRDVLEAEAFRRFVESLSIYERQSIREGAVPSARRIEGLGPTIAITSDSPGTSALATVGLATELSFHLGVLLAFAGHRTCEHCGGPQRRSQGRAGEPWRCVDCGAEGPAAEPQHFSPSTYAAACLACHGVGTIAEPRLERLIVAPAAPILRGAMYSPGYFPQSYLSKPESLGYWMLQGIANRYGFDPFETPWREMTTEAQDAFLHADEGVEVDIPPRGGRTGGMQTMRWRGVLRIMANWDLGGMYVDHVLCGACGGGRLQPEYLDVQLGSMNRQALHGAPLAMVAALLDDLTLPPGVPHWVVQSRDVARRRLAFLRRVGLGHVHLDRLSRTLSAGEAQRVKLASLLGAELSGMTVLLDEPTRGLHPREVDALSDALGDLRDARNTVVLVDHDPLLLQRVDHLVVLGPGAGTGGGRVVAAGPANAVRRASGSAARILAPSSPSRTAGPRRSPRGVMVVRQPTENNLDGNDIEIPLGVLVGLCGVSGSGKSTLAIDIIARALAPMRLTTSVAYDDVRPGAHAGIDGAPARVIQSDQSGSGIHTPGAFLGVLQRLRRAYARSAEAAAAALEDDNLSPDCDRCHGRGNLREEMGFLPSIERPCDACDGTGYRLEIRNLAVRGDPLAEVARRTLSELLERWGDDATIARPLGVASTLGLGYLELGQPSRSLSGGEAQRLKLARELARRTREPTLFILDEPTVGLHARDVARLVDVLDGLVERGHSILVVEHDPLLLACCDRLLELGPGGGPDGGRLVASGTPEEVASGDTPSAAYLRASLA
jgi:excinuclease ABC subunit A